MAQTSSAYYDIFEEDKRLKNTKRTKAIMAKAKSIDNAPFVPDHIKARAKELLILVQSAYIRSRSWINYNIKDATIKIEAPCAADKMAAYRDNDLMDFCRKYNTQESHLSPAILAVDPNRKMRDNVPHQLTR